MPQLLHFGPVRRLALIGIGRVISGLSTWAAAGVQQEALEAFHKFIAGGQVRPAPLQIEKLALHCGIVRLIGAPLAVGSALVTGRNMLG